jgi:CBS domain containing-hemolysin-like protein
MLREDELVDQTGFRMPEGPYETLAGFVMAQLGHIPAVGETAEYHGWRFTVTAAERRRIEQVKVQPPEDWSPPNQHVSHEAVVE